MKPLADGSIRCKLIGGPRHGMVVRAYGTDPIPFPASDLKPACTYTWQADKKTFVYQHKEN